MTIEDITEKLDSLEKKKCAIHMPSKEIDEFISDMFNYLMTLIYNKDMKFSITHRDHKYALVTKYSFSTNDWVIVLENKNIMVLENMNHIDSCPKVMSIYFHNRYLDKTCKLCYNYSNDDTSVTFGQYMYERMDDISKCWFALEDLLHE